MVWGKILRTWRSASQAKELAGYPIAKQFIEMASGYLSGRKLTPSEYIDYRLFEPNMRVPKIQNGFVGYGRVMALNLALNDLRWGALSFDKLSFYSICDAVQIPFPRVHAVYSGVGRTSMGAVLLRDESDVVSFFAQATCLPLFCKPIQGTHGNGAALIKGYDHENKLLLLEGKPPVPVSEFVEQLRRYGRTGFVFQELVRQHPDLERLAPGGVSGLRLVVLVGDGGPQVIHAIWKVKRTDQLTDHFSGGATGNLLADVDPDTGRVRRVLSGLGLKQMLVHEHPDSGACLDGIVLPGWTVLLETMSRAALAFPGVPLQSWDVAVTKEGPLILEMNYDGDMNLIQAATGRGVLSGPIGRALLNHRIWGPLARRAL
ncbi:hypothetical protein GCM10023089_14400 [Quisquiliibacterium transsilvanicum]